MSRSFALVLLAACGAPGGGDDGDDDDVPPRVDAAPSGNGSVFDAKYTSVSIEIDFENGEQPYTGPIVGFGDTFDLSQANLDRIFAGRKAVVLPRVIADMENVGPVADEELTSADILALAAAHRDLVDTATVKTYYMVFVSGYYADASGPLPGVLGVSIGNSGVIAMFKDVIESTNIPALPNVVRYVEQSTLIHELAHSIGLTDNGVPMVSSHKDAAHGAHCNNEDCVMFWQNEGSADATQFAQQKLLTGSSILFDSACLADVDALSGGP